jgi:hypothetical protein
MARTVAQIYNQMYAVKVAQAAMNALTSTSTVAYWSLKLFIVSVGIAFMEQLQDVFLIDIEGLISSQVPGTAPWIQGQVIKFQYNATTPDAVVQDPVTYIVSYPVVNTADLIISNCAVVVNSRGQINVKATTGTPPGPLSTPEKTALLSYLNTILPAGQNINLISVAADTLGLWGTVFYNGQFNAAIATNVQNALAAYIASFATSQASGGSFNGIVKVSDIEKVILAVPGVVDWVPSQITVTASGGTPINLVTASAIVARSLVAYSGYIVNDPGNLFSATLSYQVASN